jgi:hypothetical protein
MREVSVDVWPLLPAAPVPPLPDVDGDVEADECEDAEECVDALLCPLDEWELDPDGTLVGVEGVVWHVEVEAPDDVGWWLTGSVVVVVLVVVVGPTTVVVVVVDVVVVVVGGSVVVVEVVGHDVFVPFEPCVDPDVRAAVVVAALEWVEAVEPPPPLFDPPVVDPPFEPLPFEPPLLEPLPLPVPESAWPPA